MHPFPLWQYSSVAESRRWCAERARGSEKELLGGLCVTPCLSPPLSSPHACSAFLIKAREGALDAVDALEGGPRLAGHSGGGSDSPCYLGLCRGEASPEPKDSYPEVRSIQCNWIYSLEKWAGAPCMRKCGWSTSATRFLLLGAACWPCCGKNCGLPPSQTLLMPDWGLFPLRVP